MVRKSSSGSIACWILAQTSSLVTLSLQEMHSILLQHLISMAFILLCSFAVRIIDSKAHRKTDVTREHNSCVLEIREVLLSFQIRLNSVSAAVVCAILEVNKHSYTKRQFGIISFVNEDLVQVYFRIIHRFVHFHFKMRSVPDR